MSARDVTYTRDEWIREGCRLFGRDLRAWRFRCPRCKNVATGREFAEVGARPDDMAKCCIGRFVKGRGCDWAAYGLLDICTVHVDCQPVFEFSPCDKKGGAE